MRFSRLHLENWRNFTHVDIALQQRMFLIGANATGKSNLLDVFRFLRDLVRIRGGFEEAILDRGGVAHLRSLAAHGRPDVVVEVRIADDDRELWGYRLAFGEDEQGRPLLKEEKVWKAGVLLLNRPDEQDASDKELLRQTHLESSFANRTFREVAHFFNTIRYYHIVPQLVREAEPLPRPEYDPYGRDFIAQIAELPKEVQTVRLQRIERALQAAIPQFTTLEIYRDIGGYPHLRAKYEHWQANGDWQTEVDLSDGMIRLIGLLWALLDEGGPLLLEEPEVSLHQDITFYLPVLMYSRTRQIVVSTQNADLLRDEGISPDEVLILQPAESGTKIVVGGMIDTVRHLTEAGLPAAETTIPYTRPSQASDILYFEKVV